MSTTNSNAKTDVTEPSKSTTPYEKRKLALLNHASILQDLQMFSCRCKPGFCLSTHDAAMVGQVRSHVSKLGSQTAVSLLFCLLDLNS